MEFLIGFVVVFVLLCSYVLWKRRGNAGDPKHLRGSSIGEQRTDAASGGNQIHQQGGGFGG